MKKTIIINDKIINISAKRCFVCGEIKPIHSEKNNKVITHGPYGDNFICPGSGK